MADDDFDSNPRQLTPGERAKIKRAEKLKEMQDDIDAGRLVVRQMSEEEKARFEESRRNRPVRPRRR